MRASRALVQTASTQEVVVGLIDTGCDVTNKNLNVVGGIDFTSDDSYGLDGNGHGTHVAGEGRDHRFLGHCTASTHQPPTTRHNTSPTHPRKTHNGPAKLHTGHEVLLQSSVDAAWWSGVLKTKLRLLLRCLLTACLTNHVCLPAYLPSCLCLRHLGLSRPEQGHRRHVPQCADLLPQGAWRIWPGHHGNCCDSLELGG